MTSILVPIWSNRFISQHINITDIMYFLCNTINNIILWTFLKSDTVSVLFLQFL